MIYYDIFRRARQVDSASHPVISTGRTASKLEINA